jgi:hypothetical protein
MGKRSKEEVADEVVEADAAEKKVSTTAAASARVWRARACAQLCARCCGSPALPTTAILRVLPSPDPHAHLSHTPCSSFLPFSPFVSSHLFPTHLNQ